MIKRILPVLLVLLPFLTAAQINIKGRVVDVNNLKPLAGANISINNNLKATITRPDGMFDITGLQAGDYKMKVTYMGYSDWVSDISVTENTTMLVSMEETTYSITEEVIIQSTRASGKTPVSSSLIDKETIDRLNQGRDMPFVIERMPATVSTSDAGTGIGYSGFRIRGTDMNRINITVNGIPLNDAESHSVFWVNMPDFASSISSMQVQRGVGSSTNGAAAFGASVNMQTSAPSADAYGEFSSAFGSFNTFRNSVSAGTGLIDGKWSVDTRLSKISSDGFIDRASSDLKSFYISAGYYGANTILKLNVLSGIEKTYQAWDGIPSYILDTLRTYNGMGMYEDKDGNIKFYENETDNYQQDHYQLMLSQRLTKKTTLNFALHYTRGRGYYEQYKDNDDLADYGLEPLQFITGNDTVLITESDIIRQKHLDNHFYGYTASLNYRPINRLQLLIGSSGNIYDGDHFGKLIWGEYAATAGHDFEWYRGTGTKKDLNVYSKANYKATGRLSLYGDLQLRTINYTITGTDDDLRNIAQEHDFVFFNPKAGAFYDVHSNGSVYASFAVAHREPNRDNYTDADPTKEPPVAERLYDYELGYVYKNGNKSLTLNGYYMHYNDQLILTGDINDVGSPVMTNIEKSYRTGLELETSFSLTDDLQLYVNAAYSRSRARDFVEKVDDWSDGGQISDTLGTTKLAFSPEGIAGFDIIWNPISTFTVSFDGKYVSRQFIDNTASLDRSLDPYLVNNLRFSYSIKPKLFREIQFNLAVNNIFNHEYETNAWVYRYNYEGEYGSLDGYFPQAGVNVIAGLSIKL
jgi:iron complex outermembrane recepter protein